MILGLIAWRGSACCSINAIDCLNLQCVSAMTSDSPDPNPQPSNFEPEGKVARQWVEKTGATLIQWVPLGGSGGIILSFLLKQDWVMALVMFPVMIVTVIWAAYSKAFLTRLQAIYQEEGTRHADGFKKGIDGIGEAIKWALAGTDKNYLRCQGYYCRDYQVEGMSQTFIPQLEEVFVPLELSEAVGWGSNRSSVLVPAGLQWDRDLEKRLRNPDGSSIWDLLQVAEQNPTYRRLLIKAWGGYGKTTLLRYLTYSYTHNKLRQGVTPRLPVLLRLRTWQETLATDPPPDLATLIEQHHIPHLPEGDGLKLPTAWAKQHLRQRKMLILWDGFDEVRADRRQGISQWMGAQMNAYPQTIFILTTRPAAFGDYISEHLFTATVFVKPFNRDQIERFVQRWYLCQEKNARGGRDTPADRAVIQAEAQARSANLFSQLDPEIRPELADLAKNPLLLNMIATLHRFYPSDELPQRRTELYREILELQLGSRPLFRNIEMPLSAKESQKVLQRLALYMVQEREDSKIEEELLLRKLASYLETAEEPIDPREFTKKIEEVSEIIVKVDDRYEFAHLSFQGYLAALEIQQTEQEDLLLQNLEKAWWKETILLYTALLRNPSPFIRRFCEIGTTEAGNLAIKCLAETPRKVDPDIEQELQKLIAAVQDLRYQKLEEYLKNQQWKEADEETYRLMITTVGKEPGQHFEREDMENFPCEDLRTLDQLWVNYSRTLEYPDGKFGFSVQKKIWLECGGRVDYKTECKLGEAVGWRDNGKWELNMIYDLSTSVPGHLPSKYLHYIGRYSLAAVGSSSLAQRSVNCSI